MSQDLCTHCYRYHEPGDCDPVVLDHLAEKGNSAVFQEQELELERIMSKAMIANEIEQKALQTSIVQDAIHLPPTPVFVEHIERYVARTTGYLCKTAEDFEAGKALRAEGSQLKRQIEDSYRPLKQFLDAIKQPVLDRERADLATVANIIKAIDGQCEPWLTEQNRIAQEAADKRREEERQRREKEKEQLADLERTFGSEEEAKRIEEAPVIQPRPVTASSGYSYARGVRTKPKRKVRVVNPSAVKREYCEPSLGIIDAEMRMYFGTIGNANATPEQVKKFEEEVGGIQVYWE